MPFAGTVANSEPELATGGLMGWNASGIFMLLKRLQVLVVLLLLAVVMLFGIMFVKNTSATVDIYSGRQNPVWEMSNQEFQNLEVRLEELTLDPSIDYVDLGDWRLGYNGIFVSHTRMGIPVKKVHVYGNRISVTSFGRQRVYLDSEYMIQMWLLDSLEQHIDPLEYDYLIEDIQNDMRSAIENE